MRIVEASWAKDQQTLAGIRNGVFVEEQNVPPELEWDGKDERAFHWLALDERNQPIATLRMLRDGHLGRMAVVREHRGKGVGSALLNKAIQHARMMNLREVYLHAQTHAIPFYERAGFEVFGPEFNDAGLPHRSMRLRFREDFLLGKDAGRHSFDVPAVTAHSMIAQCRRQLRILSDALAPDIYDNDGVRDAVSSLARLHANAEVRILVLDVNQLTSRGHRLLQLQQRMDSKIRIRTLDPIYAQQISENYLIADHAGIMVLNRREPEERWVDYNNRPVALNYLMQYDLLWEQATEDPRLRRLAI